MLPLSAGDPGAGRVPGRSEGADAFSPGMPGKLNLSVHGPTYHLLQDEPRSRSRHSFIRDQEIKIDHWPHQGAGRGPQLDAVN